MQSIRAITAVLLASVAWAAPRAEAQDKKASTAITAPADGAVLSSPVADVDVAFASGLVGKKDNQHVLALELRAGGQVIATFDVPDDVRDGIHRASPSAASWCS